MKSIPECGLHSYFRQHIECLVLHLHVLLLCSDGDNLPDVLLVIGLRGDDQRTVQEIQGNAVGTFVVCSPNRCDASVGCHHDDGCVLCLQGSVEKREALDVQHVDLVDEQNTRDDFSLALLLPLCHFGIYLFSDFRFDFSCVPCEECEESLGPAVDHINFVKRHRVHDLLLLVEFSLRTLHETRLAGHGVKFLRTGKGPPQSGDSLCLFIDCHHVSCRDVLRLQRLDHFVSQIVFCLHLCGLQDDLSTLHLSVCLCGLEKDLHHLALNHLCLLTNSHTDRSTESLSEGFCFGHLKGEDLRSRNMSERNVVAEGF
mmetsp:Transcript_29796/g.58471  ORF Transcript_29796/g.58471 Transcript_29796/m.58471 type:complete len:314 (+) Transcript_29796:841-1782(+)